MFRTVVAFMFCVVAACGGSSAEGDLDKAREQLAASAYDDAISTATHGLAASPENAVAWRLELVALEAEARGGKGALALTRLERVAGSNAAQVTASLYVQTASQLKEGGDAPGAITVLDAGAKRFPDDGDIAKAIEQAKASGSTAEQEALKSLGYID